MNEFFTNSHVPGTLYLTGEYSLSLVILSIGTAIISSILALQVSGLAKNATNFMQKQVALLSGSIALGIGIWAMHFIGMLALNLCISVSYDPVITAMSILPGIFASWVALSIVSQEEISRKQLMVSGLTLGAGIGLMHYTGMAAMRMVSFLRFDPWLFGLSIVVAVVLAILAIDVRFRLQANPRLSGFSKLLISGIFFGLAISGMHYTGMAAARFVGFPRSIELIRSGDHIFLANAITILSILAGVCVLSGNFLLRFIQIYRLNQETQQRLLATVNTSLDGILTFDKNGFIVSANTSSARIFDISEENLIGTAMKTLLPSIFQSDYIDSLESSLKSGDAIVVSNGAAIQAVKGDGDIFSVRLAVGRAATAGQSLFIAYISDMTQQVQMQKEILARERKYRTLISNIPGVAFRSNLDERWTKIFVSDSIEELTGWRAEEFTSGAISLLDLVNPNDLEWTKIAILDGLKNKKSWNIEYRIRTRSGEEKWIAESAGGVFDDQGNIDWIDGVMLDVTKAKRQSAEFAGIVYAIRKALAVVEFDMQGNILDVNDQFLLLTGYQQEELIGKNHRMLCPGDDLEEQAYQVFWKNLRDGRFQSGEYHRLGKNGRDVWIQAAYNPILDADGNPWKVVKLAADLSLRKIIEHDLICEKERAEKASAAKGMFLANMSHEIRTPMNAILGFTQILLQTPLQATQERHLRTVQQSAKSLLRLLNDILDTAKLERGAIDLEYRDFSLSDLCDQLMNTFQVQCDTKDIALELNQDAGCPRYIHADELRLRQVLTNILGNAIKFTEKGKVALHMSFSNNHLTCQITDTGIGISADRIDNIFAPFTQADSSMTRRFGGTGLGTTIAKQLVELMGGTITATSELGVGSCFTIVLPVQLANIAEQSLSGKYIELPALRILIADDVPENIEMLQILLEGKKHTIFTAHSGQEAIQLYRQLDVDLVLMDVQMPEIDGLEATRQIVQIAREQGRSLPKVIALTASVLNKDRNDATEAGMIGFATKPVDLSELEKEIARVLGLELHTALDASASQPIENTSALINWPAAIRRWQKKSKVIQSARQFLLRMAEDDMAVYVNGDAKDIMVKAHQIKGGALNLELTQVAHIAEQIESDGIFDEDRQSQLRNAIELTLMELDRLHSEAGQTPVSATNVDAVLPLLTSLRAVLAQNSMDDEKLEQIASLLKEDSLQPLQDAIHQFDFDMAIREIDALLFHLQTNQE